MNNSEPHQPIKCPNVNPDPGGCPCELPDPGELPSGTLRPGDDLLFLIVAGDIRENVKPALAQLLDRIKAEAIEKCESFSVE